MFPAQRRKIRQQGDVDVQPTRMHRLHGALEIDCVPLYDCGSYQIQAAGTLALGLETAVSDFAETAEKHRPGERVARLALVQAGVHAAAQLDVL